ncbi:hypothetical protein PHLCEN_2v4848 [Hermanssonia centrifuga]|uniref:Uncharacterized protein n=1 Tax=Hermanssonia centrifuga TaxID=98765 RepID=A0A2R6PG78_9APHY|nr:hypothetical protein PHLCEN_2v4848 [Hermanssonia centrifuga]
MLRPSPMSKLSLTPGRTSGGVYTLGSGLSRRPDVKRTSNSGGRNLEDDHELKHGLVDHTLDGAV